MRRRPLFYVFNMILPCFLITTVAFLGFCVPSDSGMKRFIQLFYFIHLLSGEKVSIGVTTLLSMTVFLMLVTDSMPPNSESLPLIGLLI
jgi:nicotinic acetylcholine receptor